MFRCQHQQRARLRARRPYSRCVTVNASVTARFSGRSPDTVRTITVRGPRVPHRQPGRRPFPSPGHRPPRRPRRCRPPAARAPDRPDAPRSRAPRPRAAQPRSTPTTPHRTRRVAVRARHHGPRTIPPPTSLAARTSPGARGASPAGRTLAPRDGGTAPRATSPGRDRTRDTTAAQRARRTRGNAAPRSTKPARAPPSEPHTTHAPAPGRNETPRPYKPPTKRTRNRAHQRSTRIDRRSISPP